MSRRGDQNGNQNGAQGREHSDAELRRELLDDPRIDPSIKAQLRQFQQANEQQEPEQPESRWAPHPTRARRKRVVLADASKPVTVLQRFAEVEEQTSVGEHLLRTHMRKQLRSALRVALLIVLVFAALPITAYLWPTFAELTVVGVRLPWLLLGVLAFPLLFCAGFWYHKQAERNERSFVEEVRG